MNKAKQIFEEIRDRPYSTRPDKDGKMQHCYTKNTELLSKLADFGHGVRGRLGDMNWHDLGLSQSLIDMYPQDIQPTHYYCEIFKDNEWHILDVSWDPLLKSVGAVSEWDKKNTPGFKIIKLYTIEEQTNFYDYWSDTARCEDYLLRARSFLDAFDDWVIEQRKKAA